MHKYLSEVGIEALQGVANWLRSGAPHEVSDGAAFSMHYWNCALDIKSGEHTIHSDEINSCGSVMCIGGAVEQFNGVLDAKQFLYHKSFEGWMELSVMHRVDPLDKLFYPDSPAEIDQKYYDRGPEQVANVVQHFIDTGEVDWSLSDA